MFGKSKTKRMSANEATKLALGGKLRFYDLRTMKRIPMPKAIDEPDFAWARIGDDYYTIESASAKGITLRLT